MKTITIELTLNEINLLCAALTNTEYDAQKYGAKNMGDDCHELFIKLLKLTDKI